MTEKTVSLTCVAAIALWVLTFVFLAAGSVIGLLYRHDNAHPLVMMLMSYGLVCSMGAATVSVRLMFKRQNRLLRSAFELGRDAAPPVRRVH